MVSRVPGDYIRKVAEEANNESSDQLRSAVELYDRKLWHQLTELCLNLSDGALRQDPKLYTDFLLHFQKKVNPVSLVRILTNLVNNAFDPTSKPEAALQFINTSKDPEILEVLNTSPNALILFHSLSARLHLSATQNEEAKSQLEYARALVDVTFDLEAYTHACYYQATAEFHKIMGPAADFYRYALLFLAYTSPDSLNAREKNQWAFDIAIAALVGEDIYTFEEVLRHGLIQDLGKSEQTKWLIELMEVMNRGDVDGYAQVVVKNSKYMNAEEALVRNAEFLKKKSKILGLVAMAEQADGPISFADIEKTCKVEKGDVEYLIMRALSLELIKGTVDGVESVLEVKRVRPKLLDRERCGAMAQRLGIWKENVGQVSGFMEKESQPLVSS